MLRIAESLATSQDVRLHEMVVLARPHGANQEVFRHVSVPNLRVWLRDETLPDTEQGFAELEASLNYCVCVAEHYGHGGRVACRQARHSYVGGRV